MQLREIISVAFQAIRVNTLRSVLTMLGIVIGVAAVITMVAVGTGAQRAIDERIDALGAQLLSVYPGQSYRRGIASNLRVSLTSDDALALARDGRHIADVVPQIQQSVQIKSRNQNLNVSVVGSTPASALFSRCLKPASSCPLSIRWIA